MLDKPTAPLSTRALPQASFADLSVEEKMLRIRTIIGLDFGTGARSLRTSCHRQSWLWGKRIAIFLAFELTNCSCAEIGRCFDYADHTTVLYHLKKVRAQLGKVLFVEYLRKLEMRIIRS